MKFPKNFLWGVASSSYQVEGAAYKDGRSQSIWDTFSRTPTKVYAGENGDVSVDQYHRYKEDVALMKELGVGSYRFSIAWPRVLPDAGRGQGNGKINPKGLDYYKRLIDELLSKGIQPAVTLYHWDLPQVLQDKGGWGNRDTAFYFQEYASEMYEALGDRVPMWMTLNEPWCAAILGYLTGMHAPGIRNKKTAYDAIHHFNLAHGLGVQAFRSSKAKKAKVGLALNIFYYAPFSDSKEDKLAADRALDRDSRMFLHPLFGKGYPKRHLNALNIDLPIKQHDMDIIAQKIDFVGLNYYSEMYAKFSSNKPEQFVILNKKLDKTEMGWAVYPQGIVNVMRWVSQEIGNVDLYITENGCASADVHCATGVHDHQRVLYFKDHIAMCRKAISEGILLKGYFAWSIIDNFEWAYGYQKRFGLVYCDYSTLARTRKDSFYAYKQIIADAQN